MEDLHGTQDAALPAPKNVHVMPSPSAAEGGIPVVKDTTDGAEGQAETPPPGDAGGASARRRRRLLALWPVVLVLLLAVFVNLFVARLGFVNGSSMEPTLSDGSLVVIWKLGYEPQNGDIVVTDRTNATGRRLTKRVIATGGQRVHISPDGVAVDGILLDEPYILPGGAVPVALDVTVPAGYIFVMGDNRDASLDSRELGVISTNAVLGRAVFRLYPFSAFGPVG